MITVLRGLLLWVLTISFAYAQPIKVVASFSILKDLVQQVGKEHVQVVSLVDVNSDAHVFQPSPKDSKTIVSADLVVLNGLGFDAWMTKLIKASAYKGKTLVVTNGIKPLRSEHDNHEGHHHDDDYDPHAWQNPILVKVYVKNIAQALANLDPKNRQSYESNAKQYSERLDHLDRWAAKQFYAIPEAQRHVLTSHDAFAYLGKRYRVRFLAAQGLNTSAEPSAKQIAQLIQQIRQYKIRVYFIENMSNSRLIQQIARETQAKPGGRLFADALSDASGPASNYLLMMQHNVTSLIQGMKK